MPPRSRSSDPRVVDVIGMADHSAKGGIDPPLPHRLDPFYPQAITSAGSVTWRTAFRAPQ
ncbi:hypothetical protein DVP60_13260 [Yersinia enterocolitica]|nr:hypothetical protein [Yersinia enterocolitica]EKN5962905.1 hypothetical protein [Yersinia enterocolitica]EKN5985568.1 hypothetical protein [Yersinia enterocolitica]EKN5989670.1 hypothetical protein [Yersinia enterocolitica]EKN6129858.1 hypothetical protein [Yersinia enterocolitica]